MKPPRVSLGALSSTLAALTCLQHPILADGPTVLQGEALEVLAARGNARPQDMASFGRGAWEGDSQLWWTGAEPGDALELALPVGAAGFYQIHAAMTKAVDYGIMRFALDGAPLGRAHDFYQPDGVSHTGWVHLGTAELSAGDHVLGVTVAGAHPDAKPGHMFGLDALRLTPVGGEATPLFDGRSLAGWSGDEHWWRVEGGAIVGEIAEGGSLKSNQYLFWAGELADFELDLQFRISGHPSANSGIQFRCDKHGDSAAGYQADIDDGALWAGRIYDEHGRGLIGERGTEVVIGEGGARQVTPFRGAAEYAELVKAGEWNRYRVRAVGPRIDVWLNGERTITLTDHQFGAQDFAGQLALQLHSGPGPAKIEFKDLALRDLGRTELPKVETDPNGSRRGVSPAGRNLGFEDGTLGGWTATGDAWEGCPIEGDTVAPRRPGMASGHDGNFWVGGYERSGSDAATGTLTSDPFEVTHPWGSFLVAGGSTEATRVEIVSDEAGEVLHRASGTQVEDMRMEVVDLRKHLGAAIRVRVVDESDGFWGHVNYDDFRFHNARPAPQPARLATNPVLKHLVPNPAEGAGGTVATMWVPEGFEVTEVAVEPTVTQPIAFTFDERGRMWVAEAHSYPRKQPEGQGKDRIVILEDGDGDGAFETKKVFAEGLNLVSGLEVGYGGVWVGAAPQLLYIPDKDRDDVPDAAPVVLLDGWGYQDTHETLNSFIWGPDGWLYGNQGVFCYSKIGKPGAADAERVELRAGVWRYHPKRGEFEVFAHGCSNQWGIDFNEVGDLFITHCRSAWGGGSTSYVVQGGHYWNQSNSHHAPFVSGGRAGWNPTGEAVFRNYLMASARYGHGEGGAGKPGTRAIYGGHAHCGTMIYLGSNWPAEYRDKLFTHNLHGHQMNMEVNERRGSGYETVSAGADHLYTADPRFIGVDLKCGPDGAVYMIDWQDKQHCHNNNEDAWDRSDGGIYRMAWSATYAPVEVDLGKKSHPELMRLALSEDGWESRMALRLIHERSTHHTQNSSWPKRGAESELFNEAMASENPARTLRAIWALYANGLSNSHITIKHPDEKVRAWTVRLRHPDLITPEVMIDLAKSDPSAAVRLALASELPKLEDGARWRLAEALAARSEDAGDAYLPKMIWFGIAELAASDADRALRIADTTPMPMLADSIVWFLSRDAAGRAGIAERLASGDAERAARMLWLMAFALPDSGALPPPPGWAELARSLRGDRNAPALDKLGGLFGDETVLAKMRATAVDKGQPLERRREAFEFLRASGDDGCLEECLTLLGDADFRAAALPMIGRFDDARAAAAVLEVLPDLGGAERSAALAALASKPVLARALLGAIGDGQLPKSALTSLHIRSMGALGDASLDAMIGEVWGRAAETSDDAKASIARYRKLYSEAPLWSFDRGAGAAVFAKVCATCHVKDGEGIALGPDLTGSHGSGLDYFIENIVDPNAVVGEGFQLNVVTKKDGTVLAGMVAGEDESSLTVRTVTEAVTVPRAQIKDRQALEHSMMPAGLLETLSEKEVIELLKYLTTE